MRSGGRCFDVIVPHPASEARVTRFTLSVATVLFAFATVLASAANACISCNYRPEVADTRVGPPKKAKPQRPAAAAVKRPAKKNVAKRPRPTAPAVAASRAPATETATAPEADTGKTTSIEGQTGAESAGDTTAALADDHGAAATDPPPANSPGGCRKFSATAGTTVTVPCE